MFLEHGDAGRNGETGDGASGSLEASVKPLSARASLELPRFSFSEVESQDLRFLANSQVLLPPLGPHTQ